MVDNQLYSKKRIVRNTFILYVQMLVAILAQLYAVPVLLRTLGIQDYGIYNVVAGIVTMFSFVSGSLSSGAQRFIAYAIGKNDMKRLKEVFSSTLAIYLGGVVLLGLLLEILGTWFLNAKMEIPSERIVAANWVFQFTIVYFLVEIMIIPYRAEIIAHEKMNILAGLTITDSILRLCAAIGLGFISFDCLIAYSSLLALIAFLVVGAYVLYCMKSFEECRHASLRWSPELGSSLLSYSGWNMVGSLAIISRNQGLNIIQNLFFGPMINAAHAIAQQVQGVVNRVVDNIYTASRPQITKLYAAGRIDEMWGLIFQSAKFAFFLMMMICIPAILELDTVLRIWLKDVPPFTAAISKLMLLSILIETLVNQLVASFQAANRIKRYQLYASTILLLNIPVSYFLLKYFASIPLLPYSVSVGLSALYALAIVMTAKREACLDAKTYCINVIFRCLIVVVPSFMLAHLLRDVMYPSFLRVIYTSVVSLIVSMGMIWFLGIGKSEKTYIVEILKKKIK